MHGFSSEEFDSFVSDDIFLRGRQSGVKNVFICRIVVLFRIILHCVEPADMQRYIL